MTTKQASTILVRCGCGFTNDCAICAQERAERFPITTQQTCGFCYRELCRGECLRKEN